MVFIPSVEAQFFQRKNLSVHLPTASQIDIVNSILKIENAEQPWVHSTLPYARLTCPMSITYWLDNSSKTADSLVVTHSLTQALTKIPVLSKVDLTPSVTLLFIK